MKIYYLLLAALILSFYNVQTCEEVKNPTGVSSCENVKMDSDYDDDGAKYCCYAKGKEKDDDDGTTEDLNECWGISQDIYDKIEDYIDELEKGKIFEDLSIDCASNYIMISLLSLILLFI